MNGAAWVFLIAAAVGWLLFAIAFNALERERARFARFLSIALRSQAHAARRPQIVQQIQPHTYKEFTRGSK